MKALIVTLIAGLAWFSACASSSDDDDGTESHFLDACDSSATCGSLSCLDGRCTRACGDDADCADLGDAECRSDGAFSLCAATGDTASGGGSGGDSSASGGTSAESGAAGSDASGVSGGPASGGSMATGGVGGTNATGGTATDGGATTGGTATDGGVTTDGGAGGSDIGGGDLGGAGAFGAGGSGADLIACAEPTPRTVDGEDTGFVQCGPAAAPAEPRFEAVVLHRERAVECPNLLPRADDGACTSNGLSEVDEPCLADSDCTAGPYGFCSSVPTVHYPQCGCSYGCVSDADCGPDEVCECADPVGLCRPATCTVDSDCASNALCASAPLAVSSCTFFPAQRGYRCQSGADACLSDAECTAPEAAACTFSAEAGARTCERAPTLCP